MKLATIGLIILVLPGCGEVPLPQRFTDCRSVSERVALENNSPGAIVAVSGSAARDRESEEAFIELEAQRAGFMTVVHEQRVALGLTRSNRYAQRYLKAYSECRKIDAGAA